VAWSVLVHARRQAALAIALHGVSGKRDDGNMFASLLFFLRIAAVAVKPSISGI